MSYVAPNSTIELMSGVNLTPDYKDTIYFPNESAQSVYFANKIVKRFHNQMYTRISDGVCRIECNASEIRYCDYIRFRNDRVIETNKYYYGFITKVEYVNENVSEIHFEIDELQTWLFNQYCSVPKCYIERQHSTTDAVGANLVPEPLAVNETIPLAANTYSGGGNVCILVIGTFTLPANSAYATDFYSRVMFSGYPSTVKYIAVDETKLTNVLRGLTFENGLIKGLFDVNDLWTILGCYIMPSGLVNIDYNAGVNIKGIDCPMLGIGAFRSGTITPNTVDAQNQNVSIPGNQGGDYSPRNNKLKTYPYMYFRIDTPLSHQDFKYENFGGSTPTAGYRIESTVNPVPTLTILPVNYETPAEEHNYALNIDNFPSPIVYESGVYGSLGQFIGGAIRNLSKAIVGAGLAGMGLGAVESLGYDNPLGNELIYRGKKEFFGAQKSEGLQISPKSVQGSGGCASLDAYMATNNFRIVCHRMGLREQTARLFDQFFSVYGYAQNRVATPNFHARTKWTYIKTRGAKINGQIPSTAKTTISRILDNGITFWDSSVTVGDYTDTDASPNLPINTVGAVSVPLVSG